MAKLDDIQAIAFDLDGTLVDSVPGLALATQKMLADLNLPTVTNEQVKNWVGNGIDVMLERVFKAIDINSSNEYFAEAKQIFSQHYDKVMDEQTTLFPHVKQTLKTLYENHYPLALVTNKPAQFLPGLLSSLVIKEYFSLVLGGGDVIKLNHTLLRFIKSWRHLDYTMISYYLLVIRKMTLPQPKMLIALLLR